MVAFSNACTHCCTTQLHSSCGRILKLGHKPRPIRSAVFFGTKNGAWLAEQHSHICTACQTLKKQHWYEIMDCRFWEVRRIYSDVKISRPTIIARWLDSKPHMRKCHRVQRCIRKFHNPYTKHMLVNDFGVDSEIKKQNNLKKNNNTVSTKSRVKFSTRSGKFKQTKRGN